MDEWIDRAQRDLFSKKVYAKAWKMYTDDHALFFTNSLIVNDVEKRLMALHKAKSGAKLLGLIKLAQIIEEYEKQPEDLDSHNLLRKRFEETILFVEAYLLEEN